MLWLIVCLFVIAGLGVLLPTLIYRQVIVLNIWTQILGLCALLAVAALDTWLCHMTGITTEPMTIFIRVVLVDGVCFLFLNIGLLVRTGNAPHATKE